MSILNKFTKSPKILTGSLFPSAQKNQLMDHWMSDNCVTLK